MQTKLNIQSRKVLVYHSSISCIAAEIYIFLKTTLSQYISPIQFYSYMRMPHLRVNNAEVPIEKRSTEVHLVFISV